MEEISPNISPSTSPSSLPKILLWVIIVVILLLVAGGSWLYLKEKEESKISETLPPPAEAMQPYSDPTAGLPPLPGYIVDAEKARLTDSIKEISGTVQDAQVDSLTVEAEIVDLDNLEGVKSLEDLPKTKKTYQVSVGSDTEFIGKKMGDIKAGDEIQVQSQELVYKTNNLTATRLITSYIPGEAMAPDGEVRSVSGQVSEIEEDFLVIKGFLNKEEYVKGSQVVIFRAKIMPDTNVARKNRGDDKPLEGAQLSEIKPGDSVLVMAGEDLKDKTEFGAKVIILMVGE